MEEEAELAETGSKPSKTRFGGKGAGNGGGAAGHSPEWKGPNCRAGNGGDRGRKLGHS